MGRDPEPFAWVVDKNLPGGAPGEGGGRLGRFRCFNALIARSVGRYFLLLFQGELPCQRGTRYKTLS